MVGRGLRPLNQPLWQTQLGAKQHFAAGHLAGVGFVVVAGEMEEAVEDEDFDLC